MVTMLKLDNDDIKRMVKNVLRLELMPFIGDIEKLKEEIRDLKEMMKGGKRLDEGVI